MRTELSIQNRIALLRSRNEDNGKIIKKLERQLKKIRASKKSEGGV